MMLFSNTKRNQDRLNMVKSTLKARNTKLTPRHSNQATSLQLCRQRLASKKTVLPLGFTICKDTAHPPVTQISRSLELTCYCPQKFQAGR